MTLNAVIRVPAKDSYTTSGPALMGRQSANEGFLKAWFQHTHHKEFWCMARYRDEAQVFARVGESVHLPPRPTYRWISQQEIHRVGAIGTLYLPGPQVADIAWIRRRNPEASSNDFSIVGMTHTSCELPIQDSLADMLTAPVYPWDAQICPSVSVQTMVARLLEDESQWLKEHLGATRMPKIQLPVLPLGVDVSQFDVSIEEREKRRQYWRQRWSLAPDDVCVLYVGRLDLRTKANLFPTFDALQLAHQKLRTQNGPNLVLVLAGWFASEWDEQVIREAILKACPDVRVLIEDGRPPEARMGVWHAADIFTSLVDNIQETFGLTPIEAMAASLPVVVSDYDGYRESVRDGVDGYRISSCQPGAGVALDIMDKHSDRMTGYREYVSQTSSAIGLDLAQASQAFERLASDGELRKRLGANGLARARALYDWKRLIPRYQNLFSELALLRQDSANILEWTPASVAWGQRHPRRSDPYHSFSHYPTLSLDSKGRLFPGPLFSADKSVRENTLNQMMARPVYQNIQSTLHAADLHRLLCDVGAADRLGLMMPSSDRLLAVGWLVKCGLLAVQPGSEDASFIAL